MLSPSAASANESARVSRGIRTTIASARTPSTPMTLQRCDIQLPLPVDRRPSPHPLIDTTYAVLGFGELLPPAVPCPAETGQTELILEGCSGILLKLATRSRQTSRLGGDRASRVIERWPDPTPLRYARQAPRITNR